MSETTTTKNGNEIIHSRERMGAQEFKQMVAEYGLGQETPIQRAEAVKSMPPEKAALFLADVNRRLQGSDATLVSKETKVMENPNWIDDKKETVAPEHRYDLFVGLMDKISKSKGLNPARVGDTLGLGVVILHPFADGNGRTSRMMALLFRDEFDQPDYEQSFDRLAESRDDVRARDGFIIPGYIPYFPEGADQSDPNTVDAYFTTLLTNGDDPRLYAGPASQAPLVAEVQ